MTTWEALRLAQDKSLDLVEIAPTADPPVCRIMNYSKFLYEEKKKLKEQKRIQREMQPELKEICINPTIHDNDLNIKIKNIKRILDEGDKVKVAVKFFGRQLSHTELGRVLFEKILVALPEVIVEKQPVFEGKQLFIILAQKNAKEA